MNSTASAGGLFVAIGFAALAALPIGCNRDCSCAVDRAATPVSQSTKRDADRIPQATFGGGIFRNMINLVDKKVPTEWSVEEGKFQNVKWVAELGKVTHTNPVVQGGRVFIGTNNVRPRDPKLKGHKGVLMCFAETDGAFLWQNVHDMPEEDVIRDGPDSGLCSTPTVEGDFVYYCTPACEVICAHVKDGKIAWRYDMMKELKVSPCYLCACSPLVVGDKVYVVSGNGRDGFYVLLSPKAPSFVALEKENGRLAWHSDLPGDKIVNGQWSNATYAEVEGKGQVIFPGGDGVLYSLEPATGKLIWKFNCSPAPTPDDRGVQPYFLATPVVSDSRCYIAVGAYPELDDLPRIGHLFCIDITKSGDVSCKNENFDPADPANKGSALIWHFGGAIKPPPERGRKMKFGPSTSTAAVHDGLVYVAELSGYVHCLDAKTGQHYWEFNCKSEILASPYWVNGKIYVCDHNELCNIFEHGKKFQKPRTLEMGEALESTPVIANGTLYVATPTKIYAIGAK